MKRVWLGPLAAVALCAVLYWPGLTAWFHQDDFAWLGLGWQVNHGLPLGRALFAPMTEGTVRVLSERLYFVGLYSLFGLNAAPFRLLVFLTQAANLFLLASLTRRLTGSAGAGVLVGFFWTVQTALSTPLSWSSAYNQILCAFFALLGLWLLFQFLETGRVGYYLAQWVVFLLGFGASEFMIVYPAAATLVVLVRYRRLPASIWALFVPSLVFVGYHVLVLQPPVSGPYATHFDARAFLTFATYWRWSLGPGQLEWFDLMSGPAAGWLSAAMSAPILAFALAAARRRDYLPAALLGWYALWLVPIIALPNHITEYYPALASIGLAMLGSWAVVCSWRAGRVHAAIAIGVAAMYVATSVPPSRLGSSWHHEQGRRAKELLEGVARSRAAYPGRTVLVSGVDEELFWAGVFDDPFRRLGDAPVFLTPETPDYARQRRGAGGAAGRYKLPEGELEAALATGRVVLYDAATRVARPVSALAGVSSETILVGDDSANPELGQGWYQAEGAHRWMGRRAWLAIARPRAPSQRLRIEGYAPAFLLRAGPVRLAVSADDRPLGAALVSRADSAFAAEFGLPAALAGEGKMRVTLDVGRAVRPNNDSRELGLAISSVAVR